MYKCLCCGWHTLPVPPEEAVAFICPVCMWENDVFAANEDEPSDENHGLTLRQGRANYQEYGACDIRFKQYVREPTKEERMNYHKINHRGSKVLETERLGLRFFTLDDAGTMFHNWASASEVTKFLTWPTHASREVSEKVLQDWGSSTQSRTITSGPSCPRSWRSPSAVLPWSVRTRGQGRLRWGTAGDYQRGDGAGDRFSDWGGWIQPR